MSNEKRVKTVAEINELLDKVKESLKQYKDKEFMLGELSVAEINEQVKGIDGLRQAGTSSRVYLSDLERIYTLLEAAKQQPDFEKSQKRQSRVSSKMGRAFTSTQPVTKKQVLGTGQTPTEPKAVEPKQKELPEVGTEQIAKEESEVQAAKPKVETKLSAGAKEELADMLDKIFDDKISPDEEREAVADMEAKLAAIKSTLPKVEAVIKGEGVEGGGLSKAGKQELADMLDKVLDDEISPKEEREAVVDMEAKLAAIKSTLPKVEAVIKGEGEEGRPSQTVSVGQSEKLEARRKNIAEPEKKAQHPEFADFKEFATNAVREMGKEGYANEYLNRIESALVSGNVKDNENRYTQARTLLNEAAKTKNDVDRGRILKHFTEALKTIAQEIQSPSQAVTKSNVTQSFVSIINKADNIVTAGARVQDQITDLRRDINIIKKQPEFQQYQKELAQERLEHFESAMEENFPTTYKEPQQPKTKANEPKLNPDQKAAYQAISKLDKLLERVERSKVGIVKSILKGQVRKHLEAMNANPLKDTIQKVGGLKTEKTQDAKVTPASFKK